MDYPLIYFLWHRQFSNLSSNVKKGVWRALLSGVNNLCKETPDTVDFGPTSAEAKEFRSAYKMYLTLISWIVVSEETEAGKVGGSPSSDEEWRWASERERAIAVFGTILQRNIFRFWNMSIVEETAVT
jgi:hypothetical protein